MELDRPINEKKAALIDRAFGLCSIDSIADLGGCWGVNGGYTFHALKKHSLSRACIVDGRITNLTKERAAAFPQLELIQDMLGADSAVEAVGSVDALIMYDILLHQVAPNWDEFLQKWAPGKKCLIIYNQNWTKTPHTVRFIEQGGLDWYKENVYYTNEEILAKWFETHDDFAADQGKKKRDIHNFWQWGIVKEDLVRTLSDLGFELKHHEFCGAFTAGKPWLVNDAFVFIRKG